jgi:hypothetical protein
MFTGTIAFIYKGGQGQDHGLAACRLIQSPRASRMLESAHLSAMVVNQLLRVPRALENARWASSWRGKCPQTLSVQ